jgi:WD40 repeat protein
MVLVWDTRSWELVAVPEDSESPTTAFSVDWSPDGAHLAAVIAYPQNAAGLIRVWDTSSYSEVLSLDLFEEEDGTVFKVLAFDPLGDRLAARGSFRDPESQEWHDQVRIYDLDGNLQRVCCEHWWEPIASSISYSPDGAYLLTAGMDQDTQEGTVILWDADSGDEVRTFLGHTGPAYTAAFSPDGSFIASGAGGDVRIWETGTGTEIALMDIGPSIVHKVAMHPDGSRVASASDTFGLVQVWALDIDDLIQIARDRLTRTFTAAECEIYGIENCPLEE